MSRNACMIVEDLKNFAVDIATRSKPGGAQKPDCFNTRLSFKYREV